MYENTILRSNLELACEAADLDAEDIIEDYEGHGFGVKMDPRGSSMATATTFGALLAANIAWHQDDPADDSWMDEIHELMSSVRSDHRSYSSVVVYFRGWGIA